MFRLCLVSLCLSSVLSSGPWLPAPEFDVNLDLAPELRFTEVIKHFNSSIWDFYGSLKPHFIVNGLAKQISTHRGPENEEFQGEIRGIAQLTNIPEDSIHAVQMLYEFNTLMVPIVNITWPWDMQKGEAFLGNTAPRYDASFSLPLRFGCTGIIAMDKEDGTVYHARNLDFSFAKSLQPLTYVGIFKKSGKEVFRAQMIAAYSSVLTGMRKGTNGYTIEINTRYLDHKGGNAEMIKHVFTDKRTLSGWVKRKVLETTDNYEGAVQAFSQTPYAATEYNIISGVKKGTILARNPDGLAYQLPLDKSEHNYVIMTNFDYIWHDIKERFDPTSAAGFGKSRRKAAQKILDNAAVITPELLFNTLNNEVVIAKDTIFQAIMNVETGLWNASLPACKECGRGESMSVVV